MQNVSGFPYRVPCACPRKASFTRFRTRARIRRDTNRWRSHHPNLSGLSFKASQTMPFIGVVWTWFENRIVQTNLPGQVSPELFFQFLIFFVGLSPLGLGWSARPARCFMFMVSKMYYFVDGTCYMSCLPFVLSHYRVLKNNCSVCR